MNYDPKLIIEAIRHEEARLTELDAERRGGSRMSAAIARTTRYCSSKISGRSWRNLPPSPATRNG